MSAMRGAATSKKSSDSPSVSKGVFALIALVIILVAVQFGLTNKGAVKGASTEESIHQVENKKVADAKARLQGTLEDKIDSIKNQVTQLDPKDLAESSPQVQKIIKDLKDLQGVPKDELKKTCETICKSL